MTQRLAGVPGTEAGSSKRGFYYQDVLTALAWTRLDVGEELHIEVAEDFAVADPTAAEVVQIKDSVKTLTLSVGVKFIERVLNVRNENPARRLAFVFLTTAAVGEEKLAQHRPDGRSGILYWQDVQRGLAPIAPLVRALELLAPDGSRLKAVLSRRSPNEIEGLIQTIHWAYKAPELDESRKELADRVALIADAECKLPHIDGRRLASAVLDAVTLASTKTAHSDRVLTYGGLRELIVRLSTVTLTKREHAELVGEAELAKSLPKAQVNQDIKNRLEFLQLTRFLNEANAHERATVLAEDVRDGGACQIGDPQLRAAALSWCARITLEANPELASVLLENAERLATVPEWRYACALSQARISQESALRLIADDRTPEAETIRYAIFRKRGTQLSAALKWIEDSAIESHHLDAAGQYLVISDLLIERRWSDALDWVERLAGSSFETFPSLHWVAAHALIAWAAPDAAKDAALAGPPIANEFSLRDDAAALAARRRATALLQRFGAIAEQWSLPATAQQAQEFHLWLRLEDYPSRSSAVAEVARLWKETDGASRWLPLAIRAGVGVDLDDHAAKLDKLAARYGSLSFDDARARFALVLATAPAKWIDSWALIQTNVAPYFHQAYLEHIYIQGLIQVGRIEEARTSLERSGDLLPAMRQAIEVDLERPSEKSLARYRSAVEQDESPATLQNLVSALVRAERSEEAASYALRSFELTKEHGSAETYVRLLAKSGRSGEILVFLDENKHLLEQSNILSQRYVDVLVRHGRWKDAEDAANEAEATTGLFRSRVELDLQLAVLSGNWSNLNRILENAQNDNELTAHELIRLARVASDLGNTGLARRLTVRAIETDKSDAIVVWNAYLLAVQGQWENSPEVKQWFAAAIATANEPGSPVRSGSLSEIAELAPKWSKRTAEIESSVSSGELFLALAAKHFNRPLASLIVGNGIANERQTDFRRLIPIPLFSGVRRADLEKSPSKVVLDATALLTLGRLGVLDKLRGLFDSIWVPHSTGAWLFSETANIRFHQPSQIAEAKRLAQSILRKDLRVADANLRFSSHLAREVGRDLAQLIAACQLDRDAGRTAYVVRPTPLHRVGSLREEAASVDTVAGLFCSTIAVMESLRQFGAISEHTFDEAVAYLKHVDNGWPSDTVLPKGSTLYLDDLTVTYLQHVGVLKTLAEARYDIVIHSDVQSRALAFTDLDEVNESVGEVLEQIRRFFVIGQSDGLIKVLPLRPSLRSEEDTSDEPSASALLSQLFQGSGGAEAVIIDDRAANKFPAFEYPSGESLPIFTSLEVVDWLMDKGTIDDREWLKFRTTLRRSGYLFLPLGSVEVTAALKASTVHEDVLYESVAAKAIRENLLLGQASGTLQLPSEGHWLATYGRGLAETMAALWKSEESDAATTLKSGWLVEQSRYDGFADRMLGKEEALRWVNLDALVLLRFLMNLDIAEPRRQAYNQWMEEAYLNDLQQARPRVFSNLCAMVKGHLLSAPKAAEMLGDEVDPAGAKYATAMVVRNLANSLPRSVRDEIFDDDSLFDGVGLARSSSITVHVDGSPSFNVERLYASAASLYTAVQGGTVTDEDGCIWTLTLGHELEVSCEDAAGRRFVVPHAQFVSPDSEVRMRYAALLAKQSGIAIRHVRTWMQQLEASSLAPNQISKLELDFQSCPIHQLARIKQLLNSGTVNVSDIALTDRKYFERLVPPWPKARSMEDMADALGQFESPTCDELGTLIWASHPMLSPRARLATLSSLELEGLIERELPTLDLWSVVGLLEALAERDDALSALGSSVEIVALKFRNLMESDDRLELTSSLAAMIDSSAHTAGTLSDAPVYWRRLATFAHAALIERAALSSSVDIHSFADWAGRAAPMFQAATLCDLQREPRWNGFLLQANQLKQEFIGRVLNAFEPLREAIDGSELYGILFAESEDSLSSKRAPLFSSLPGPLEAADEAAVPLVDGVAEMLGSLLDDVEHPLASRVLVASQLFGLGAAPEWAVSKLASAVGALDSNGLLDEAEESLTPLFMRLSLAAASTRSGSLAGSVRQLVLGTSRVPMSLRAYAGLSTCGSEADEDAWKKAVGDVFGACTRLVEDAEDARRIIFIMRTMCDAKPSLKPVVSRDYARLLGLEKRIS